MGRNAGDKKQKGRTPEQSANNIERFFGETKPPFFQRRKHSYPAAREPQVAAA